MKSIITLVMIAAVAVGALWAADPVFVEKNGVVVIEMESMPATGKWVKHAYGSSQYTWTKFASGGVCYQFTGNTEKSGPVADPITYKIKISTPGTYECFMRGLEAPLESGAGDQANDCYIKMAGQSSCEGAFTKMVLHGGSYQWSWSIDLECGTHQFRVPTYNLSAGVHTFSIAGRSKNFFIDRFHIIKKGAVPNPKDQTLPESGLDDGTTPNPNPGDPVGITTPGTGATLAMGSTITLTGTGENLSWSYDANSDGLGAMDIGTGSQVSFTVPTGVRSPMELTLTLIGTGGSDTKTYQLTAATGIYDPIEAVRQLAAGGTMAVYNSLGVRIMHISRADLTGDAWQSSLSNGVYHCVLPDGAVRTLTVVR